VALVAAAALADKAGRPDEGSTNGNAARAADPARRFSRAPAPSPEDGQSRDASALTRDEEAAERDRVAMVRDYLAMAREERLDGPDTGAAMQRVAAALDREHAISDRRLAASDREHAAAERSAAGADELTGVLRRGVGLAAVQRAIERAHRTNGPLVLAFVDVDGLKALNDSSGHPAGDRLLRRTAELITTHLRPYDVVVRVGGDEFVCSLHGIGTDAVRERFELVSADLTAAPEAGSISVGLAELKAGDTLDDLVLKADLALLATRGAGSHHSRVWRRPPSQPAR
jgi:diguanylate cyclase (GGDEF)-like protein